MKKYLIMICLFFSLQLSAQDGKYKITDSDYSNKNVEMADEMRSNGKIYVVVGVIFLIFAGITFYIYKIDRKLTALEKSIKSSND
ncbi:CcmD family protein [Reichenbachiella sp. MALMAid0571]|uniref:CcmD family protein n=1 Tax=Reichenbachiella sp. MALMAid0571 TaxID=3143939 RepID=UPI0032DE3D31